MAKKRAHGEGSIYQLGDGRWRAALSIGGGKRAVSPRTRTQREARRWLDDAKAKRAAGIPIAGARRTVGEWLDVWLEAHVRPTVRPSSYAAYESRVRMHLRPALGAACLTDLTPADVRRMMTGLAAKGLTAGTIGSILVTLRHALTAAVGDGVIRANPAAVVRAPAAARAAIDPPTVEAVLAMIAAAAGHRVMEAFIPLAVATGLRHGELLALTWDRLDIRDRENASLTVAATVSRGRGTGLVIGEAKTTASRKTVFLAPVAADALARHRVRQAEERLIVGTAWIDQGLVFAGPEGQVIDPSVNVRAFHAIQDRAGVPRCRVHDLRHAFVTFLLAAGVDVRTIQELARHGSIGVTMNTYAHVLPAAGRDAAGRMDDLLGGQKRGA